MSNPLEKFIAEIKTLLSNVFSKLALRVQEIALEIPPEGMGDFAFPCFSIAKDAGMKPDKIAFEIVKNIEKSDLIAKVENVGPYVNFFLNAEKLKLIAMNTILERKEKYGFFTGKKEKIILEHTSANPTGPIHVGRARNPIIGDTLARVLRTYGYKVETQYYVNDMGKQVGIMLWGIENIKEEASAKGPSEKQDHRLVYFYQKANEMMEQAPHVAQEIAKELVDYELGKKDIAQKVRNACEKVLAGNIETLKRINIEIDKFVWESEFVRSKAVANIVAKLSCSELSRKEDNACYLDLAGFGLPSKDEKLFFTREDGTTLYAIRDSAYHIYKFDNCDIAINILGEDHKLEVKQLEIILSILGVKKKPEIVFYAFVSLPEGRMSTRAGRVVYLDDLIEEAVERAYAEVKKRREELALHEFKCISEKEMRKIAEIVGIGAIRYNIIKVQNEKPIVFKWEEALNFEGNSAPFIQYAHARACSILSKSKGYEKKIDFSPLKESAELKLIKILALFPNVVEESALSRKPYKIANYAYEVATQFNQFYRDIPVLKAESDNIRNARLALVDAARTVLKNALELIGINAPEEM